MSLTDAFEVERSRSKVDGAWKHAAFRISDEGTTAIPAMSMFKTIEPAQSSVDVAMTTSPMRLG